MKLFCIAALVFALALTAACKREATTFVASSGTPSERRVTIAVSDDDSAGPSVGFKLEPPVPDTIYLKPGQKVHWTIINNTKSAQVTSLIIDNFNDPDQKDKEPFEGGPPNNIFRIESLPASLEKSITSTRAKRLPQGVSKLTYTYKITVNLSSGGKTLQLDPRIIIGN
jgi:hypothetical protein